MWLLKLDRIMCVLFLVTTQVALYSVHVLTNVGCSNYKLLANVYFQLVVYNVVVLRNLLRSSLLNIYILLNVYGHTHTPLCVLAPNIS